MTLEGYCFESRLSIQNLLYEETTVKPVLDSQPRDSKMTFDDKWLLNTGQLTVKIKIWVHRLLNLNTGGYLIEVTANTNFTVYCYSPCVSIQ